MAKTLAFSQRDILTLAFHIVYFSCAAVALLPRREFCVFVLFKIQVKLGEKWYTVRTRGKIYYTFQHVEIYVCKMLR